MEEKKADTTVVRKITTLGVNGTTTAIDIKPEDRIIIPFTSVEEFEDIQNK